jgi:hypothetical protein
VPPAFFNVVAGDAMSNRTNRTAKNRKIILERLREFPHHGKAIEGICSRSTYCLWRREEPEFDAEVEAAIREGDVLLEDALIDRGIIDKDTTALIFALKTRKRDRYGDKQQIEHSGVVSFADLAGIAASDAEPS